MPVHLDLAPRPPARAEGRPHEGSCTNWMIVPRLRLRLLMTHHGYIGHIIGRPCPLPS